MWSSLWIAMALGLIAAIPIMKWPGHEQFWAGAGIVVNWIQSGVFHALIKPRSMFRTEKRCTDRPTIWGGEERVCQDIPVCDPSLEAPAFNFWGEAGNVIGGIFVDTAAQITAAVIEIFIVLMFMGKEKADAKRREIFSFKRP